MTPAPKQTKKRERIYVVRPGDTLGQIALDELGSSSLWPRLVESNPGLDPARLQVGARLVLPPKAKTVDVGDPVVAKKTEKPSSKRESSAKAGGSSYKVRSGDSLWRIADRALGNGERWREILAVNPGLDANKLNVGMTLKLPKGAKASAPKPQEVAKATKKPSQKKGRVR